VLVEILVWITHERVNGRRPNMVGMDKGWPSRNDLNFGAGPDPGVDRQFSWIIHTRIWTNTEI